MVDTKKAKRGQRHKVGSVNTPREFWCAQCNTRFQQPVGDMWEPATRFITLLKMGHDDNSPYCTAPKVHFLGTNGSISPAYFTFKGVK